MTITQRNLVPTVALTAATTTLYTTPAAQRAVLRAANVHNPSGGATPLTLYIVPTGKSADATTVVSEVTLAAKQNMPLVALINQVLEEGTSIQAKGADLTLLISGVEIV